MATALEVENWDDDLELEGAIFAGSTHQPSIVSSRLSIRSDSNAGDDDWNVALTPNDEKSTSEAISSAKLVGIPISANVPASALLGGTIKKLGKKTSRANMTDDWAEDLDFADVNTDTLKLKPLQANTAADDEDGFSDWDDGSLGIREAGARRDTAGSSVTHVISPSMTSTNLDSEDDGLDGLVIPTGPLNLAVKKRKDEENSPRRIHAPIPTRPTTSAPFDDKDFDEDFLMDLDFGANTGLDLRNRTLNRNVKPSWKPGRETQHKPLTTITFSDRSNTRIPRPVPSKPHRLEPVMEHAAHNLTRAPKPETTITSAGPQLRSKRSMPVLRSQPSSTLRPPVPTNNLHSQLQNARMGLGPRRESGGQARAQSPTLRTHSRLSHGFVTDTPTRTTRRDIAPPSLAREAAVKRTITKPARRKNFGDGTELDTFDDLPTSAVKESKFLKQPTMRGPPKAMQTLRKQPSQSKLGLRERMMTPLPPQTPGSPTKHSFSVPSFARDTASSRIAREQKLNTIKPSREAVRPRTDWAAQIAARTPHASPTANRAGRRGPTLITPMGKENIRHFQDDAVKKGMHWNAVMSRWEGNDSALQLFDTTPPPSPPRPALITNISGTKGVQVVGGMVFDPQRMCWLKMGANQDPMSASLDDEDDPFRDIEDLQESKPTDNSTSASGRGLVGSEWLVGEEFDLGPEFIRRQREEEINWRQRIGGWFADGTLLQRSEEYKWAIRDIAGTAL